MEKSASNYSTPIRFELPLPANCKQISHFKFYEFHRASLVFIDFYRDAWEEEDDV